MPDDKTNLSDILFMVLMSEVCQIPKRVILKSVSESYLS